MEPCQLASRACGVLHVHIVRVGVVFVCVVQPAPELSLTLNACGAIQKPRVRTAAPHVSMV